MYDLLFTPYTLGTIVLKNRIVMAPMTRNRCLQNIPGELVADYYAQRAEAGLIITEGTSPSINGLGYPRIPGLYTQEHVDAWKKITRKVHQADGKIFVQLMHTGRASHIDNMPTGSQIIAPSAIAVSGQIYTDTKGLRPYSLPLEMNEIQINKTITEYTKSAVLAMEAGFDGVEIHGANGYLIDQFLNTQSNKRTDKWGGSIENRMRFAVSIAKNITTKIGANKVGMRLSPYGAFNDMEIDKHIEDTFENLSKELNKLDLLYLHIVDHSSMGTPEVKPSIKIKIRNSFKNTLILSGGYDGQKAEIDLSEKKADLVSFGRPFISNPNLVTKIRNGIPLKNPDISTFYTPGEKGYTDYATE
jgi:N-ethylmaleimide reductase